MATRRQSDRQLTAEQVAALADERFPKPEWDADAGEDWNVHVGRCEVWRVQRRAFAAEYGYTPLDLFFARYPAL